MADFTVTSIIDGDTFTVSPGWVSNPSGTTGDTVRPTGYDAPERGQPGFEQAKQKLTNLIFGEKVQLGAAVNFDHGRIVCDVFYNRRNLADYFTEYK